VRMIGLSIPHGWTLPRLNFRGVIPLATGALMAAGAIHIGAILLVPSFAEGDGWSRLAPHAGIDKFTEVPVTAEGGVAGLDPLFVNAACRLDLSEAPAGITVDARDRFWSVALYDPTGAILFSLNDRTAVEGKLDMIVVNAEQNAQLKRASTAEIELSVVAESPSDDLIALLRLFAPTRAAQEDARRVMARAECLPAPSVMPAQASGG
jgi:uncharacterized membrane protein